jgi:hypothetical protein
MRFTIALAIPLLMVAGCELVYDAGSLQWVNPDAGVLADASVHIDASLTADVGFPDSSVEPLDASELSDASGSDSGSHLDASEPPDATSAGLDAGHYDSGFGLDASAPADASEPPDASSPGLDASAPPDSGIPDTGLPPGLDASVSTATLVVTQNSGASTTLVNGDNDALKFRVATTGSPVWIARQTFAITGTGAIFISSIVLKRGATTIPYTTAAPGLVTFAFTNEEFVNVGTPNDYTLVVTMAGASSGNTLTVALLGDPAVDPSMSGSSGYVYNPGGDSLYPSSTGLCSSSAPYFVWSGVAHTPPSPVCAITAYGSPDYSTGFQVGAWSVQNVLTAS